MLIGAHVAVAEGFDAAYAYAASVGCEACQIFAKSPLRWRGEPLDPLAGQHTAAARAHRGIRFVWTHTAYLINLGAEEDALFDRSWRALADELARAAAIGADGVVTHLGTNRTGDAGWCAERIADGIAQAYALHASEVPLFLENTAGAGTTYGSTPAELAAVIERLPEGLARRTGVCVDTCHAHAAGYDLSVPDGWGHLIAELADGPGLGRVRILHVNDCRYPAGMRRDRHAWIGEGTIGLAGFAHMFALVAAGTLTAEAAITEMPGEVPTKDAENIRRLKRLRDAA